MKEFKENKIPLSFYYWIHNKISKSKYTYWGYIRKEEITRVLIQYINLPKRMCPSIIKELELLDLIKEEEVKKEGLMMKVKESKSEDEIIKGFEKELGLVL